MFENYDVTGLPEKFYYVTNKKNNYLEIKASYVNVNVVFIASQLIREVSSQNRRGLIFGNFLRILGFFLPFFHRSN